MILPRCNQHRIYGIRKGEALGRRLKSPDDSIANSRREKLSRSILAADGILLRAGTVVQIREYGWSESRGREFVDVEVVS